MSQIIDIRLLPEKASSEESIRQKCAEKLYVDANEIGELRVLKRSIDARKKPVNYQLRVEVFPPGEEMPPRIEPIERKRAGDKEVCIVGAGPAGYFASLKLLEYGIKPVIYERGKDVRSRRRDLAAIHKEQTVNSDSNYCFGEGGAGTYSDGKLYTRSKKRGDVNRVLQILVEHGADEDILVNAHPHIGTNKLPQLIASMRDEILTLGGEIHFDSRVEDIILDNHKVSGVIVNGESKKFDQIILATGHSARDIFTMLHENGVKVEFKPFALGVRCEHPQSLIDQRQYHQANRGEFLPPAAYSLVCQVGGRGVYSFCMCPGGIIAPCATAQEEVVTNGWSPSKRNNPYANSGIVVPVEWEDVTEFHDYGPLAGMEFQKSVEQACWKAAGSTQHAPAQRLADFVEGRLSKSLPDCSYGPGVVSARVDEILPRFIAKRLQKAFKDFDRKIKGFIHPNAAVIAPESRTSSPVRIPRDRESYQHPECEGLYPCGEGAGYAGGIVSAAIDGEKVATAIAIAIRN